MTNLIIIAILAVILVLGIRSSIKHFRGEGGCCGGSTYKAHKKKLDTVIARKTFTVEGMSCQHCINRVMEAVNSISGASAVVHLKRGTVVVSMDREISDTVIKEAIEKAGYTVTGVE